VNTNPRSLPAPAVAAVRAGNKIEAIKIVREVDGCGLKPAKELVENFIAADPELHARFAASRARGVRRTFFFLALLVALVVLFVLRKK